MNQLLQVNLYSPEKPLAEISADYVHLPGAQGYLGILPGHTALISELGVGELRITGGNAGSSHAYFISGGYIEVLDDQVKILVDVVERHDEIDVDRAISAEDRAKKRLEDKADLAVDIARALAALERAKARRKLAQMSR